MTPIRLGSYNVHSFVGTDRVRDLERVCAVIRQLECDALGLQEVDARSFPSTLDELERHTGMRAYPGMTVRDTRGEFGNTLLSRLPLHKLQLHDLSVPGREPRGAIEAHLEIPGGRRLHMITTHLGLRSRERRAQVDRLLKILEGCRGRPLILAGDLNEWWPSAAPLRRLKNFFEPCPRPRSFPASRPLLALDQIRVLPRTALLEVAAHGSPLARRASDHRPIVAEILA